MFLLYLLSKIQHSNNETFINNNRNIPKIIHQTAPKDKKKWPETWKICQKTWKKHFPSPEYKYMFWNDDDLDIFIKRNYNWFYKYYKGYKSNICRVDSARYFILHYYGGIYADMDFYCFKNFYDKLEQDKICIVESPYKFNESLQNSLMASPKNHIHWNNVFSDLVKYRNKQIISDISGPRLLDISFKNINIQVLPYKYYNPDMDSKKWYTNKNLYTKHYLTSVWTNRGMGSNIRDKLFTT